LKKILAAKNEPKKFIWQTKFCKKIELKSCKNFDPNILRTLNQIFGCVLKMKKVSKP
jgi:hypothetical protein